MKKERGFTLIELLAVIVILGVIMIIAIPSVTNYITNSRKDSYVSDAKMFLDAAKIQLTADEELPHGTGEKVLIPISDIALDKGGEKSPFGNDWDLGKSYVVVENIGTSSDPEYVWKVALEDAKGNCIPLTNDTDLKREVVGTGCSISSTLISKITSDAVADTSINFNDVPTETTSGVFVRSGTENDTHPIYYYRGIVANNNVKFANFCWKIVRTTETGGIKLIYNGVPAEDGSCNNTGTASQLTSKSLFNEINNDNAYVGYMYGATDASTYDSTHANTNNSTIKTAIDAWYANNMTSYTSKLEDTVWCYDRSITTYGNTTGTGAGISQTYYSSYTRVEYGAGNNPQPSLICVNYNDRFTVSTVNGNGDLMYPTGLLTADEVTLAGSGWAGYSTSSYLYTGETWWLGSPEYLNSSNYSFVFGVRTNGMLYGFFTGSEYGVRPSISLKSGTVVTTGDGTVNDPYVIN